MKKSIALFSCLAASLVMATSVSANVDVYALDGRTLSVKDEEVELYTAEGMGWFLEKPVTMYALDGRTLVVPANLVEAHQKVGWYLEKDLSDDKNETAEEIEQEEVAPDTEVAIQYTDGTIVTVPGKHLETYKSLGWKVAPEEEIISTVVMSDSYGNTIEIPANEVNKYMELGWTTATATDKQITVYNYEGNEKQISDSQYSSYKSQGWFKSYEEAVYNYAVKGNGTDFDGADKLLANKKYELSFTAISEAIDKIESSESTYVDKLYDKRADILNAWNTAAKSPLGFINYWFAEKDGKDIIVFEYRNVGENRIKGFKLDFEICDASGNVIEKKSSPYKVDNLQMNSGDKKRVAWIVSNGDAAKSIKNLKVVEASYADGTVWSADN